MTLNPDDGLFPDLRKAAEERLKLLLPTTDLSPGFLLLGTLLLSLPINERLGIIDGFDDAVRKGVIKAVPLEGPAIAVGVPRVGRKRGRRLVREHRLKVTPEAQKWIDTQRAEARYQHMTATGQVSSTEERLNARHDDFDRLAELYRQTRKRGRPQSE